MNSADQGHATYYTLPMTRWSDVDAQLRTDIIELSSALTSVSAGLSQGTDDTLPPPGQFAFLLTTVGTRLLSAVAADETDLRQVITTLRTALTVCWDMYGIDESERVSVREHMQRLQSGIEAFEADLVTLHQERQSDQDGLGLRPFDDR